MGYFDEMQKIKDYITNEGEIIELTPNRDNVKAYYQELETYDDMTKLAIRYPGYKTTGKKCDYCVYLVDENGEHPISHIEIMHDLYDKTTMHNYQYMKQYIEDVATIGRDVNMHKSLNPAFEQGFSFEVLTDLMFYIAIQEDINYPTERFQGRKMCFYRYLEAIYCKVHTNHQFEEAVDKATVQGYIPKNWCDVGDLYDVVSKIQRYR
ncbi:MAG: hypothetical protein NC251_09490 [Lachnoclostridium sp.]|nr:hypothetical protein [Lachnospira sp.]MCM1248651.1 hypothetical protein [Lachnoclostridium sp.]